MGHGDGQRRSIPVPYGWCPARAAAHPHRDSGAPRAAERGARRAALTTGRFSDEIGLGDIERFFDQRLGLIQAPGDGPSLGGGSAQGHRQPAALAVAGAGDPQRFFDHRGGLRHLASTHQADAEIVHGGGQLRRFAIQRARHVRHALEIRDALLGAAGAQRDIGARVEGCETAVGFGQTKLFVNPQPFARRRLGFVQPARLHQTDGKADVVTADSTAKCNA